MRLVKGGNCCSSLCGPILHALELKALELVVALRVGGLRHDEKGVSRGEGGAGKGRAAGVRLAG